MIALNKKFLWMTFFISPFALANDSLFTVMDDPATAKKDIEVSISGGYQLQTGNSKSSNLTAKSALTLYSSNLAYSFWGNATNNSSNNKRSSETYQLGARTRYNLTKYDYLFGQASWLTDRYNGFDSKDVFAVGYGRQIFDGPIHSLKIETGPSVRYGHFTSGGHEITRLGYIGGNYEWKISDNTTFRQGISFFSRLDEDSSAILETALQVAMTERLSLYLIYNLNWNDNPPRSATKRINTKTSIQLGYAF
ncbi:MAG TPA: YdiY family protein [Arsenophonus sp.]